VQIDDQVRRYWARIQQQNGIPVNTIGMPIKAKDERMLSLWRDAGMEKHMPRYGGLPR